MTCQCSCYRLTVYFRSTLRIRKTVAKKQNDLKQIRSFCLIVPDLWRGRVAGTGHESLNKIYDIHKFYKVFATPTRIVFALRFEQKHRSVSKNYKTRRRSRFALRFLHHSYRLGCCPETAASRHRSQVTKYNKHFVLILLSTRDPGSRLEMLVVAFLTTLRLAVPSKLFQF
jgi:hypothetical protein